MDGVIPLEGTETVSSDCFGIGIGIVGSMIGVKGSRIRVVGSVRF